MNRLIKYLAPLVIIPLMAFIEGDKVESSNAKGSLFVNPEPFKIYSFAKVSLINQEKKDTSVHYANVVGKLKYDFNVDYPTEYKAIVEPGCVEGNPNHPGDKFVPYHSKFTIHPGKNDEITLKANGLEKLATKKE